MFLKQCNSNFVTYEISLMIYTIKVFSEAVYTRGDYEGTLQTENDDFCMKTKLILNRFGGNFGTIRFDEKSFFNTSLGFTPYWDCKPTNAFHADSPDVYTSEEFLNLSTIGKIHLKFDCINDSILDGCRQPILYSFVLDNQARYSFFLRSWDKSF